MEVLTDWKVSDYLEADLILDSETTIFIKTDKKKVEAIRYRMKGSEVFVDFEKPVAFTYYNQDKELITTKPLCMDQFPERT